MTPKHTLFLATILSLTQACMAPEPTSTLVVGATIYDGTGADALDAALRFDGDRIVSVGDLVPLPGETVIEANGLVLAPGFIDTHSHHDSDIDAFRHMPAVLSQGVTTIVRGADGYSDFEDELSYQPLSRFNEAFAARPAAVNVLSYAPHNSIRRAVMGDDYRREATAAEVLQMSALLSADLEAGAIGLATGLEYEPGMYASSEEIIALARIAAAVGGRYSSHLRDEDDRLLEAVDEIIRIGDEAGLSVHISHIKLADRAMWGRSDTLLGKLDAARAAGIDITADIYPYERWASNLSILFPDRNFASREAAEFAFAHAAAPEDIVFAFYGPEPDFAGMSIAEVARRTGRSNTETLMLLAEQADDYLGEHGRSGAIIIARGMDEADVAALMQWPFTNICSDGSHELGHPRGYGAFPRVFRRFVRERAILSLAEAIHKMSGLPAAALDVPDRGILRPGMFADLVLFDAGEIADRATMQDPTAESVGIRKVWVNGELAFDDAEPTRRYAGRVLRRSE